MPRLNKTIPARSHAHTPITPERRRAIVVMAMEVLSAEAEDRRAAIARGVRRAFPGRSAKEPSKYEISRERERSIIEDEIRAMVAEAGSPVTVVGVTDGCRHWDVTLLQWLANGAGAKRVNALKVDGGMDDVPEARLRRMVRGRFAKLLQTQTETARTRGPARILQPEELDLSAMRIEAPVAAMLGKVFGRSAGFVLRHMIAKDLSRITYDGTMIDGRRMSDILKDSGFENFELEAGRNVKGVMQVKVGDAFLEWSKGGLNMFGLPLPTTVLMGCTGRTLGDVFEHPLFAPSIRITAVSTVRSSGRDGVALTTKDFLHDIPEGW